MLEAMSGVDRVPVEIAAAAEAGGENRCGA